MCTNLDTCEEDSITYICSIKPTVDWMGNQQLKNKHKDAIETSPIHKIKNNVIK